MDIQALSEKQVVGQLLDLGVQAGSILVVHCAFSRVKPVEGGPAGLIRALRAALGSEGTLVMPGMSYDDDHPFDPKSTPCPEMGIVADTFWRQPGVLRSDSPHSFSAQGPAAKYITSPHPVDVPHGLDSPVGRVYALDGQVLLLGVDHTSNTTIHLAESMAGVRYRRKKHVMLRNEGQVVRFDYAEIDHCCQNFQQIEGWLEPENLQRKGTGGCAEARLARSHDIVEVVMRRLRANETAFLHPFGVDEECDDARESLPRN
jgi:aminoglycoside N3'-acetyltransferase